MAAPDCVTLCFPDGDLLVDIMSFFEILEGEFRYLEGWRGGEGRGGDDLSKVRERPEICDPTKYLISFHHILRPTTIIEKD